MAFSTEYRPALTVAGVDTRIELDGWAAGAPHTLDDHGTQWELQDLLGWWESPGVRLAQQPRPGVHGDFDGPAQSTGRVVTVSGTARSTDFAASQRARDIFLSVMGDPALGLSNLVVYEAGRPTKQAGVRRAAESRTMWLSDTFFAWSIILSAPDPRRYADSLSTQFVSLPGASVGGLVFPLVFPLTFGAGAGAGGQMTLTNAGTLATPILWEIRGPVVAPVITNMSTGARLEFDATFELDTGDTVLINTDTKTVMQGTISQRAALVVPQWWALDTGSTTVRFSGASSDPATARLTATWRDTWM